MAAQSAPRTILRRTQLEAKLGLSRSTIYAKFQHNPKRPNEYDPSFPRPIRIGPRAVGWYEHEIDAWLAERQRAA